MAMAEEYAMGLATWRRLGVGGWGACGTGMVQGGPVTIIAKGGRQTMATVGRILWTDGHTSIATVVRDQAPRARTTARHGCRDCGHDRDACTDLDCACPTCGGMLG